MKTCTLLFHLLCLTLLPGFTACSQPAAEPVPFAETLDRVAVWQMENLAFVRQGNLHDYGIDAWPNAVFYLGLARWAERSDSADRYREWLTGIGKEADWLIPANFKDHPRYRIYHADELCIGQFYLAMYEQAKDPEMIRSTRERVEYILAHPGDTSANHRNKQSWSWCDALFMAPPVYAEMNKLTGDPDYTDFMDREFRRTAGHLYDRDEKLFYRDDSYFGKEEANGTKVFWGRGNGWVLAGVANILRALPPGHASVPYYEGVLRELAGRLTALQDTEGYWHASLLDPESYPSPETSATALIAYGIAYGINRGILPRAEFLPPVRLAWDWLMRLPDETGKTGWIQPIGADPKKVTADMTAPYGPGAILLAGTELYDLYTEL